MKISLIILITIYQCVGVYMLKMLVGRATLCRYSPSCSEYTKRMIARYGVLKGSKLGFQQFMNCR